MEEAGSEAAENDGNKESNNIISLSQMKFDFLNNNEKTSKLRNQQTKQNIFFNSHNLPSSSEISNKRRIPGPAGSFEAQCQPNFVSKKRKLEEFEDIGGEVEISLVGECCDDEDTSLDITYNLDFFKTPWLSMLLSSDLSPAHCLLFYFIVIYYFILFIVKNFLF